MSADPCGSNVRHHSSSLQPEGHRGPRIRLVAWATVYSARRRESDPRRSMKHLTKCSSSRSLSAS
eukprot:1342314-Pyramimonas_sp.AAC.1